MLALIRPRSDPCPRRSATGRPSPRPSARTGPAGRGRIYASAAGVDDILNLKGLEVKTYGSMPDAGTSNLQQSSNSGISLGSVNNESISNINKNSSDAKASNSGNADYVANLTSMMIDS